MQRRYYYVLIWLATHCLLIISTMYYVSVELFVVSISMNACIICVYMSTCSADTTMYKLCHDLLKHLVLVSHNAKVSHSCVTSGSVHCGCCRTLWKNGYKHNEHGCTWSPSSHHRIYSDNCLRKEQSTN